MDIHFYAIVLKDTEMATAAKEKAEEIISRCNSCNTSRESNFQYIGYFYNNFND